MITTEIRPRGRGHRDDGHEEEILQADGDTKEEKVTNKHHQRIRTRRYKYRIIGTDERKRCGDYTSRWVQANYLTHSVHVAMTKSQ